MDADLDCSVLEYKYIEYLVDNNQRLRREVLDGSLVLVRSDIFAEQITDFQVTVNADMVRVAMAAGTETVTHRTLAAQAQADVYLRNR